MPSVLWHCWLGVRKGIWPVKKLSGEVLTWLSVWSEVQMICIWSSWWHCHPIISYSSKIQNGLPFWCRLTQVVVEKRPLNRCSVVMYRPACLRPPYFLSQVGKWRCFFSSSWDMLMWFRVQTISFYGKDQFVSRSPIECSNSILSWHMHGCVVLGLVVAVKKWLLNSGLWYSNLRLTGTTEYT